MLSWVYGPTLFNRTGSRVFLILFFSVSLLGNSFLRFHILVGLSYVMYHHGFSHPLHCNGKQLYSLNCDDMANLGYGGITGGYDRLRLCDFLLMLLGKDFYPWTLTYPRPGGKVRCCYDCTYGNASSEKGYFPQSENQFCYYFRT